MWVTPFPLPLMSEAFGTRKPWAIRGIAVVTGASTQGPGNMSDKYSTDPGLFGYRWSCIGKGIQVKRTAGGSQGFDIQFVGNRRDRLLSRLPARLHRVGEPELRRLVPRPDGWNESRRQHLPGRAERPVHDRAAVVVRRSER